MPRYKLTIEYDGTGYFGWQRQNDFISIQEALENAFATFTRRETTIFGAGRTDTGVHALAQVAHVDLEKEWEIFKLMEATNSVLNHNGDKVALLNAELVDDTFDARFSAISRTYRYRIINRRPPLTVDAKRAWWVKRDLDHEAMDKAAKVLLGSHDFTTFRSTQCQANSPIKTLDRLDVMRMGNEIELVVNARSFLHNQVRSLAGSLKLVGDGKWTQDDLQRVLEAKDRTKCGPVAPACGLYLVDVAYPDG